MKKFIYLLVAAVIILFSACTQQSLTDHDELYKASIDKDKYEVPPNG